MQRIAPTLRHALGLIAALACLGLVATTPVAAQEGELAEDSATDELLDAAEDLDDEFDLDDTDGLDDEDFDLDDMDDDDFDLDDTDDVEDPGAEEDEADELDADDDSAGGDLEDDFGIETSDAEGLNLSSDIEEILIQGQALSTVDQAQDESAAISAFAQSQLDELGIFNIESLTANIPSLHFGKIGNQTILTLRGIGLENLTTQGEAGVTFEVDGVHLGRPSAQNALFFDLEGLEVHRGPQGTQGGRNATGGRLSLKSARPTEDFELQGDFQYGAYEQFFTRAVLNVPILEERLMTRLSFMHQQRDGYQKNDFTGRDNDAADDASELAIRAQFLSVLPNETMEIRGIGMFAEQKGRGPAFKLIGPRDPTGEFLIGSQQLNFPYFTDQFADGVVITPPGTNDLCWLNGPPITDEFFRQRDRPGDRGRIACPDDVTVLEPDDPRRTRQNLVPEQENEQFGGTGIFNWDLPELPTIGESRFRFIGSYQRNKQTIARDFDGTNSPSGTLDNKSDAKQYSFEAFWQKEALERLEWKVGFFYFHETVTGDTQLDSGGRNAFQGDTIATNKVTTESIAGYGKVGVWLAENLKLNLGLRYIAESKQTGNCAFQISPQGSDEPCGPEGTGGSGGVRREVEDKKLWHALNPRVNIVWNVTEGSSLGFNVTRGFKAGGFPTGTEAAINPPTLINATIGFDEERVWNYEINSKNRFFDDKLQLNLTLFWTDYDPFQVCQIDGASFRCFSTGSATNRGVEVEVNAFPTPELKINGNFNFLHARIDDFEIADPSIRGSGGQVLPMANRLVDVSGNTLPKSPEFSVNGGAQYDFPLGRFGTLTPRVQGRWQSRTYYRVFNRSEFSQDPFWMMDLKLSWLSEDGRFSLEGFVNNLTDEDVINALILGPAETGGSVFAFYLPPRTYGFRGKFNY